MKNLVLYPIVYLLIVLSFPRWGVQLLQLDRNDNQQFSASQSQSLFWNVWEIQSGLNGEEVFQPVSRFPVRNRISRVFPLKGYLVSQNSYAFAMTNVKVLSAVRSFSRPGQVHSNSLAIYLGIGVRKIPNPENTDELPTLLPA